jgi:hypothetical protein
VASKQRTNLLTTQFYNLWAALNAAPGWTLGRTMLSSNPIQFTGLSMAKVWGWSNYNAGFLSLKMGDWHGVTATSNLTFSRSLGTGGVVQSGLTAPIDHWNLQYNYGINPFDIKWVYNVLTFYRPPVLKNQHGIVGRVLGGWAFAPLFTASSGVPLRVLANGSTGENAVPLASISPGNSAHYNVVSSGLAGSAGNAAGGGSGINLFGDPAAVYSNFALGFTESTEALAMESCGTPPEPRHSVNKDIRIREGIGATLSFQFVNVLNHFQPANPSLNIDSPASFRWLQANRTPRQMEFGENLLLGAI